MGSYAVRNSVEMSSGDSIGSLSKTVKPLSTSNSRTESDKQEIEYDKKGQGDEQLLVMRPSAAVAASPSRDNVDRRGRQQQLRRGTTILASGDFINNPLPASEQGEVTDDIPDFDDKFMTVDGMGAVGDGTTGDECRRSWTQRNCFVDRVAVAGSKWLPSAVAQRIGARHRRRHTEKATKVGRGVNNCRSGAVGEERRSWKGVKRAVASLISAGCGCLHPNRNKPDDWDLLQASHV